MLDDPTFKFQSWCGSEMGVLQQNVHQQEKTKPLSVHRRRITAKLNEDTSLRLDVKIDDSVVEQVSSHKILGVVIDSQMNYKSHIDELCKKLSKHIGLLKAYWPVSYATSKGNLLQWCYKAHPPVWEHDMG